MEFPSSFSNNERAYLHRMAGSLGYISKSKGWVLHAPTCLTFIISLCIFLLSHSDSCSADWEYFCLSGRDQIASSLSPRRTVQANLSTAYSSTLPIIHCLSSTTCWNSFQSALKSGWSCSPAAEGQRLWCQRLVSVCRWRLHVPSTCSRDVWQAGFSFQTTVWTKTGPAGVWTKAYLWCRRRGIPQNTTPSVAPCLCKNTSRKSCSSSETTGWCWWWEPPAPGRQPRWLTDESVVEYDPLG